jgi:hypothetical protein
MFHAPDVHTNRGHSVMDLLHIRPRLRNLFERLYRLGMLKIFGRTPQNNCLGQIRLWRRWVDGQSRLIVPFRGFHSRKRRIETVMDVHRDIRKPGVRQRKVRIAFNRGGQMLHGALERFVANGVAFPQAG